MYALRYQLLHTHAVSLPTPERQEWLHALKDTLENLPPATVTGKSLGVKGIRLANHVPGKPVELEFQPPEVCIR